MSAFALPVLGTLALWWASTGAILYLDGLSRRTFAVSMAIATALLGVAVWGLIVSSTRTTDSAAYCAFASGLAAFAWQLVSFYTGYVTGPCKTVCPPDCRGWRRFIEALRTSLYHEVALLGFALLLALLIYRAPNQFGLWTFLALWWMHSSAKINVYFGVPNLNEELLPEHMRYLVSFMRRRPMNLFFPISVTLSTIVMVLLAQRAFAASTDFEAAGFAILATLVMLAVAEHWFLVAPVHVNALWSWGVKSGPQDTIEVQDATAEKAEHASLQFAVLRSSQAAGRV
ncbi:MAG: putative photosynthetic complex assembly protein PuhE [Methylocystis sp.]